MLPGVPVLFSPEIVFLPINNTEKKCIKINPILSVKITSESNKPEDLLNVFSIVKRLRFIKHVKCKPQLYYLIAVCKLGQLTIFPHTEVSFFFSFVK